MIALLLCLCHAASAASLYSFKQTPLRGHTSTGAVICGPAPRRGSPPPLDYCEQGAGVCCSPESANSEFTNNYSPAWLPLPGGGDGLMLRVADPVPDGPVPFDRYGYSRFALVARLGNASSLEFERVTEEKIVFQDTPDTEDP